MTEKEAWEVFHQAQIEEDCLWGQIDRIFEEASDVERRLKKLF